TLIVFATLNPNFLLASCCNDDVVNGADGFLKLSLSLTLPILYTDSVNNFINFLASVSPSILTSPLSTSVSLSVLLIFLLYKLALIGSPFFVLFSCTILKIPVNLKNDFASLSKYFLISDSLSMINFTTTDCTRPADKPCLMLLP